MKVLSFLAIVVASTIAACSDASQCEDWTENPIKWWNTVTTKQIVECLEFGADPNAVDKDGNTPLHHAALFNENSRVIQVLINFGADPNSINNFGSTPLHRAARLNKNPEVIQVLINNSSDVNARDSDGSTPLHNAASRTTRLDDADWPETNPEIIQTLINAGADPNAIDKNGSTPLHQAASNVAIRVLINAGADPNARDNFDSTPLHRVLSSFGNTGFQTLIDAGVSPTDVATLKNKMMMMVQSLINFGADPNAITNFGSTPLHYAIYTTPETVQILIDAGADPNVKDSFDSTLLHDAAQHIKNPEIIQTLINAGADVEATDQHGHTPFYYAKENTALFDTPAYWALNNAQYQ